MTQNLLLWNGNVITMDDDHPRAEALLITDGRIAVVGSNEEVCRLKGEGWESIDLHGKTVLPGFIDTHVHLMATASVSAGIDLSEARSVEEVLEKVD